MRGLSLFFALIALPGCDGDPPPPLVCAPGSTQRCVGLGLCDGVQVCVVEGTGWGACRCAMTGEDAGLSPGVDGGPGLDAGPGPDAGLNACTITGTGIPPLPDTCLPRCSDATREAASSCQDAACQRQAFADDVTPPIAVVTESQGWQMDCAGCYDYQNVTCIFELCANEYTQCAACADGCADSEGPCGAETTSLMDCLGAQMQPYADCINDRVARCLP